MAPLVKVRSQHQLLSEISDNKQNQKKLPLLSITQYECKIQDDGTLECIPFKRVFTQLNAMLQEVTNESTNA